MRPTLILFGEIGMNLRVNLTAPLHRPWSSQPRTLQLIAYKFLPPRRLRGQAQVKRIHGMNPCLPPASNVINESVDHAHEIYNKSFRKVPGRLVEKS